jgi:calmodulin
LPLVAPPPACAPPAVADDGNNDGNDDRADERVPTPTPTAGADLTHRAPAFPLLVFPLLPPRSQVLEAMGQKPTEEELFQMISEVDENNSGSIDFGEFIKVIEKQKEKASLFDDESDMIDAFVACGGNPDKTGHVERTTLVKIIKVDFGLTIDIEDLIEAVDADGSGELEYEEFKELLSSSGSNPGGR